MKRYIGILVVIGALTVIIGASKFANHPAQTMKAEERASVPSFHLDNIKGDTLGMPLADYQKRHPGECVIGGVTCAASNLTYGGISATKMATFYKGRLEEIEYWVGHYDQDELRQVLKDKYGPPTITAGDGYYMQWENGSQRIAFIGSATDVTTSSSVTFTDVKASDESVKEYNAKKEKLHKTDM